MKSWSEISTTIKVVTGTFVSVAAAGALIYGWVGYLHTDAEASEHVKEFYQYQEQQYKSDKYERIDRVDEKIAEIDFQLLSDDLTERERQYLINKRTDLVAKISCIRSDEC